MGWLDKMGSVLRRARLWLRYPNYGHHEHIYHDGIVSASFMPIQDSEGKLYREVTRFQVCKICGAAREIKAHEYSGDKKKILAVRYFEKREER